jgi:hypothetical protein
MIYHTGITENYFSVPRILHSGALVGDAPLTYSYAGRARSTHTHARVYAYACCSR